MSLSTRHPRAGGGPLNALKSMGSRLRGNDNLERTYDKSRILR
jgi:hypothetical protein